jgi:hypothetical protein
VCSRVEPSWLVESRRGSRGKGRACAVDDGRWEQFWDTDGRLKGYTAPAPAEPAATEKRIPGRPRPAHEVRQECEAGLAKLNARYRYPLNLLLVAKLEDLYRWRVSLSCGCVQERILSGDEQLPLTERYYGSVSQDLPLGRAICNKHTAPDYIYQLIVAWHDRLESTLHPRDPNEEPLWEPADAKAWRPPLRTKPETVAFWTVELACGHRTEAIAPSLAWRPADGSKFVGEQRHQEMLAELGELDRTNSIGDHVGRMVEQRWPLPQTETTCHICPSTQTVVAYQRVGWVLPREPAPSPREAAEKKAAALKRRLAKAEEDAARLRAELKEAERETV